MNSVSRPRVHLNTSVTVPFVVSESTRVLLVPLCRQVDNVSDDPTDGDGHYGSD